MFIIGLHFLTISFHCHKPYGAGYVTYCIQIRWFTRGEFTHAALSVEAQLNNLTSIFSFTDHFNKMTLDIERKKSMTLSITSYP